MPPPQKGDTVWRSQRRVWQSERMGCADNPPGMKRVSSSLRHSSVFSFAQLVCVIIPPAKQSKPYLWKPFCILMSRHQLVVCLVTTKSNVVVLARIFVSPPGDSAFFPHSNPRRPHFRVGFQPPAGAKLQAVTSYEHYLD